MKSFLLEIILYRANAPSSSSSKQIWFSNPADSFQIGGSWFF